MAAGDGGSGQWEGLARGVGVACSFRGIFVRFFENNTFTVSEIR